MKIGEFKSWLESAVAVRTVAALIAQLLALLTMFGVPIPFAPEDVDPVKLEATLTGVFQFAAMALGLLALKSRVQSPMQPLTLTKPGAVTANAAADPHNQAGRITVSMVALLAGVALLAACVGTRDAYKAAAASADPAAETAYVVAEQYRATLNEVAAFVENPATPATAKATIKRLEATSTPAVLSLHGLRDSYLAVKSADNAEALQKAVDDAITKVAALIRGFKTARGVP